MDGNKSFVMEAIVTKDLWIWHAFIRLLSSFNDINVIDHSTHGELLPQCCTARKIHYELPCLSHVLPPSRWHIS